MILHCATHAVNELHYTGRAMMGVLPAPSNAKVSSRTRLGPCLKRDQPQ